MTTIVDGQAGITFNDASVQGTAGYTGFRNRIINGAMVIDQRNAGASGTGNANYPVDRWFYFGSQTSKLTWQQNSGSVTPPTGFTNYLGAVSSSAYSITSTDQFLFYQKIEGFNSSDFAWGTASAKSVTLSFWVYSSLTGTFGGSIQNSTALRCYPFSFSVSSANTWTYVSIVIPGDTSGTWLTTNGVGVIVNFSLGTGTSYSATANAWTGTQFVTSVTGATSVVGTSGATFYITGVQLEQGIVATPFERPLYSKQLADCQRYYQMSYDIGTAPGTATTTGLFMFGFAINGVNTGAGSIPFKVQMRTSPTISYWDGAGNASKVTNGSPTPTTNNVAPTSAPTMISTNWFVHPGQGTNGNSYNWIQYAASAEL